MRRLSTLLTLTLCSFSLFSGSISGQTTLFLEEFNYTPGEIPSNWTIVAEQTPPWSISNSDSAGATAPELYLGFGFASGTSRLISPVINIENHTELALKFKQYLVNFEADYGEIIFIDVTFDGGENWISLWESLLGYFNIPQGEYAYYFNAPEGATEMQVAFRFIGNHNALNGWAIDDIKVESVADNDLLITNAFAPTILKVGEPAFYAIEVMNGGKSEQSAYTVKLMTEEGVELGSVPGETASFGERKIAFITWFPEEIDLGAHTIYAYIDFEDDVFPENNRSKRFFTNVVETDTQNTSVRYGYEVSTSLPYNFFNLNSLTQTIYPSELIEINLEVADIKGIQYTCHFDNDVQGIPIQIYMGETDKENLSDDWVEPSTLKLVYDGLMDFHRGLNSIYIPLDNVYKYTGGNLVIYSNKSHSEPILWTPFMNTLDTSAPYSRAITGNDQPFDAMNPPAGFPEFYSPNISLFFTEGTMAVIEQGKTSSILIYPNPAKEMIQVQTEKGENIKEIRLINALGQVVYTKSVNGTQHSIDVKNLNPGFYLVQTLTSKGVSTKKVQVLK